LVRDAKRPRNAWMPSPGSEVKVVSICKVGFHGWKIELSAILIQQNLVTTSFIQGCG
jgi:hypothetical protein